MAETPSDAPPEIPLVPSPSGPVAVPSSPDAWGGPRSDDAPTLSDRVVHYTIEAKLDPDKHTIEGKQTLRWKNRSDQPVSSVYLHLYLNAFSGTDSTFFSEARRNGYSFRSDVPVHDGEWGYIRLDKVQQNGQDVAQTFVQPDGGPATDRTVVRFDLPEAVPAGGELTLDIDFFDQLPRVVARTGWWGSFHLVAQWFPKIGVLELPGERGATEPRWNVHEFHTHSEFYADWGSYDVTIDVPSDVKVGSAGELAGEPQTADGRTRYRYVQDDIHDFAWMADRNFAEPLKATWSHPGGEDVAVQVMYPPEYEKCAATVLKATMDSLTWFSDTLGRYPYRTSTAVIPPFNAGEAGGMEYQTFFTASGCSDPAEGTIDRFALEFVTIHEFGHGYFYGILANNEFEEPWMDEGLNEFWDQRLMARLYPDGVGMTPTWMKTWLGLDPKIDVFDIERLMAQLKDPVDRLGNSSWNRYSSGSYNTVYSRTATMLHELERRIGTEALEKAFKHYYAQWKFRHPSSADLREALAEGSGQRAIVEDLFARHVYASGKTGARIEHFESSEVKPALGFEWKDGVATEVTKEMRDERIKEARKAWKDTHKEVAEDEKAQEKAGPFPYLTTLLLRREDDTPATIRIDFADGTQETLTWDDDRLWYRAVLERPAKATKAVIDPDGLHRMDVNLLDNARSIEADKSASRRLGGDASALLQTLLAFLVSL